MAVINAGWLTDFQDIKFAPKTLFSQVYVDNPETGAITDLNYYFTTFLQKLDDRDLQVKLDSNDSVKFNAPGAIGVTGILDVPNGGTGLSTVTQHALLIGNGTNALTLLPSAAGFLVSKEDGTAPLYSGIKGSWANLDSETEGPTFYIYFSGDENTTRYNMGKIPLADASTAGVVSTSAQTFSGGKTFKATAAFEKDVGISGALIVAKNASVGNGLTVSNGLVMNSGYVSGILTPTADSHAANKVYVDAVQTNLNDLSTNIIGGTNSAGQTHHTRLSNLETRITDAENEFDTLTKYLGGYTDEKTKAFFILDKDGNAIAYFDEKGLTVTEVILDGAQNKYKNISLSSYFEKVDQLEVDRGIIYNILGESASVVSGKDHKSRLDGHDTNIATINDLNLQVVLSSDSSVTVKNVNNNIGVSGILDVPNGGTGLGTLQQYDLMYGNGTGVVQFVKHDTSDTDGVKFLVNNPSAAPSYKTLGVNYTPGTSAGAIYNIQIDGNDTGANFSLPVATTGQSGVVTTTEQTFGGKKIFSGQVAINSSTTIAALLTAQSGIDVNNQSISNVAGMTYADADRFYFIDDDDNTVAYVDSTGVSSINFISKNSDGTVKYDMNEKFAALDDRIEAHYEELNAAIEDEAGYRAEAIAEEARVRSEADSNIYSILGETTLSTSHKTRLDNLVALLGESVLDSVNGTHKAQLEKLRTADTDIKGSALYVALGTASKTAKFSDGVLGVDGILKVGNGGTGTSTPPKSGGIIYGASTSAYGCINAGTTGQFLLSGGSGAPTWHTPTVTLTGDITASATSFNTSGNVSIITDIAASGVSAGSYGPSANASLGYGGSFTIPYITVAADGRITSATTQTITLPASDNVDTKVTQTVRTTNGQFPILLRGATAGTTTTTTTTSFASSVLVNPSTGSINATSMNLTNSIEFSPASSANHGGYIDFHFNGSSTNYTSRLIESTSGTITLQGGLTVTGQATLNNTIVVGTSSYGTELPASGTPGQIFFLLVE